MVRFIHGADFHLDSPFSGLTPQQAAQRRGEQRELLDRLAGLARERQAQLVLLSGDLLDSQQVYAETAQALSRCLGSIPCPVLIAPGNHDCLVPGSVYSTLDWPDNVHIFFSDAMERVDLPELNCTVYGRAFLEPRQDRSPLAGFHAEEDGAFRLGCLHGDTAPNSPYGPLTQEEMAASGLHYLALGHIHQASGLQRAGETFWAYPGCPEGRGFDELGEKGCLWVTVDGASVEAAFLPLARRRYRLVEADLSGAESPGDALLSALPADAGDDILRVVLTGESGVEGLDLAPLKALAETKCWSAQVLDRTAVRRDLWSRAEEDTLTGLFLRQMRLRLDAAADGDERERLELAVRFGLAALEHREEPMA